MHKLARLDRDAPLKDAAITTVELLMLPLTLFVFVVAAISIELAAFMFEGFVNSRK
jgi:uncharacterized membrane protein YvlD (DUF360 family)